MALPRAFPGSFPAEPQGRSALESSLPGSGSAQEYTLDMSIDKEMQNEFVFRETACSKTMAQKHLIGQLDAFTYFVMGFQFLKYTHGSCMPPTIAHILVQFLLHAEKFTAVGSDSGRPIFSEYLQSQEQHFEAAGITFNRRSIIRIIVSMTRGVILWKFLACVIYHALLVVLYFQPVANEGRLHLLENGSWYFFSFIGESLPRDYSSENPWWLRLWQLGFCGLLFMDVVILILQLIIYQSIFLQSTISPKGLRLNEKECYILRAQGSDVGREVDIDTNGVPDIFHVKLYEALGEDPMAEAST